MPLAPATTDSQGVARLQLRGPRDDVAGSNARAFVIAAVGVSLAVAGSSARTRAARLPLVHPGEIDANALIARPGGFLRSASTWRIAAPRMAESERALKAKQAAAVRRAAAERRKFDAEVRANKLKKEKEEQAKLRREKAEDAKRLRAAKATAQRQAREAAAAEAKRRRLSWM